MFGGSASTFQGIYVYNDINSEFSDNSGSGVNIRLLIVVCVGINLCSTQSVFFLLYFNDLACLIANHILLLGTSWGFNRLCIADILSHSVLWDISIQGQRNFQEGKFFQ